MESVERFKYLVGTSHIDPENGLLYKVLRVEEKNYRGQGTFIVAYRAQVMPDGRVSTKCDKDAYHVRDIEKYYEETSQGKRGGSTVIFEWTSSYAKEFRGSIGRCTSDEASESGFAFHEWGSSTTFL